LRHIYRNWQHPPGDMIIARAGRRCSTLAPAAKAHWIPLLLSSPQSLAFPPGLSLRTRKPFPNRWACSEAGELLKILWAPVLLPHGFRCTSFAGRWKQPRAGISGWKKPSGTKGERPPYCARLIFVVASALNLRSHPNAIVQPLLMDRLRVFRFRTTGRRCLISGTKRLVTTEKPEGPRPKPSVRLSSKR